MKTLLTLAIIATLSLLSARADGIGSPKAQEATIRVTATGTDVRQTFGFNGGKTGPIGSRAVTKGTTDRDLVKEQRSVVYTGKNPGSPRQIEIAPVN